MSLADALKTPPKPAQKDILRDALARMDDDDRAAAEAALRDLRWSNRRLAEALTENGYPMAEGTIGKWRRTNGVR